MEEEKKELGTLGWSLIIFFAVFWPLIFGKVPDKLFWFAIGLEACALLVFVTSIMKIKHELDAQKALKQKQREVEICAEQNSARIMQQEEARIKAKEDEKKAERAKLARLLDEL